MIMGGKDELGVSYVFDEKELVTEVSKYADALDGALGGVLRNKKLQAGPSKMKVLEGNSRPKGEQPGKRDAVAKQPPKLVPFRGE